MDGKEIMPGCESYTKAEEITSLQKYLKKGIKKRDDSLGLQEKPEHNPKDPRFPEDIELPRSKVTLTDQGRFSELPVVKDELPEDQSGREDPIMLGKHKEEIIPTELSGLPEDKDNIPEDQGEREEPLELEKHKEEIIPTELSGLSENRDNIPKDQSGRKEPIELDNRKEEIIVEEFSELPEDKDKLPKDQSGRKEEPELEETIEQVIPGEISDIEELPKENNNIIPGDSKEVFVLEDHKETIKNSKNVSLEDTKEELSDNRDISLSDKKENITDDRQESLETHRENLKVQNDLNLSEEKITISDSRDPSLSDYRDNINDTRDPFLEDSKDIIIDTRETHLEDHRENLEDKREAFLEDHKENLEDKREAFLEDHKESIEDKRDVLLEDRKESIEDTREAFLEDHKENLEDKREVSLEKHKENLEDTREAFLEDYKEPLEDKREVSLEKHKENLEDSRKTELPGIIIGGPTEKEVSLEEEIQEISNKKTPVLSKIPIQGPKEKQVSLEDEVNKISVPEVSGLSDKKEIIKGSELPELPEETLKISQQEVDLSDTIIKINNTTEPELPEDLHKVPGEIQDSELPEEVLNITPGEDQELYTEPIGRPGEDPVDPGETMSGYTTDNLSSIPEISGLQNTIINTPERVETGEVSDIPESPDTLYTITPIEPELPDFVDKITGESGWNGELEDRIIQEPTAKDIPLEDEVLGLDINEILGLVDVPKIKSEGEDNWTRPVPQGESYVESAANHSTPDTLFKSEGDLREYGEKLVGDWEDIRTPYIAPEVTENKDWSHTEVPESNLDENYGEPRKENMTPQFGDEYVEATHSHTDGDTNFRSSESLKGYGKKLEGDWENIREGNRGSGYVESTHFHTDGESNFRSAESLGKYGEKLVGDWESIREGNKKEGYVESTHSHTDGEANFRSAEALEEYGKKLEEDWESIREGNKKEGYVESTHSHTDGEANFRSAEALEKYGKKLEEDWKTIREGNRSEDYVESTHSHTDGEANFRSTDSLGKYGEKLVGDWRDIREGNKKEGYVESYHTHTDEYANFRSTKDLFDYGKKLEKDWEDIREGNDNPDYVESTHSHTDGKANFRSTETLKEYGQTHSTPVSRPNFKASDTHPYAGDPDRRQTYVNLERSHDFNHTSDGDEFSDIDAKFKDEASVKKYVSENYDGIKDEGKPGHRPTPDTSKAGSNYIEASSNHNNPDTVFSRSEDLENYGRSTSTPESTPTDTNPEVTENSEWSKKVVSEDFDLEKEAENTIWAIPAYKLGKNWTSYLNPSAFIRLAVEKAIGGWKGDHQGLMPFLNGSVKKMLIEETLATLVAARDKLEEVAHLERHRLPGEDNYLIDLIRKATDGSNYTAQGALSLVQNTAAGLLGASAVMIKNPINRPGNSKVLKFKKAADGPDIYQTKDGPGGSSNQDIGEDKKSSKLITALKGAVGANSGLKDYSPNYLTDEFKEGISESGLTSTLFNLCTRSFPVSFAELKDSLQNSPYITTASKLYGEMSGDMHRHDNVMTLDSNHVWEIIFEPYVGIENGNCSYLPSIQQINYENYNEYGLNTNWDTWIPFTSFELNSKKMVQKSIGLYSGEISIPQNLEFTNELRLVIADDQYKSWKRYFDLVMYVSSYYTKIEGYGDDEKYYRNKLIRREGKNIYDTFKEEHLIKPQKGIIRPAPYKNLTFRCKIFSMNPQYQTLNISDLLVVLKDFTEEWQGEVDSSPTELALMFSVVGENPTGRLAYRRDVDERLEEQNRKKYEAFKEMTRESPEKIAERQAKASGISIESFAM